MLTTWKWLKIRMYNQKLAENRSLREEKCWMSSERGFGIGSHIIKSAFLQWYNYNFVKHSEGNNFHRTFIMTSHLQSKLFKLPKLSNFYDGKVEHLRDVMKFNIFLKRFCSIYAFSKRIRISEITRAYVVCSRNLFHSKSSVKWSWRIES